MKYTPIIGLEVHVELKTSSKMFCRCSADYFGKEPNTHTCPVCLGMPGALPVPNKKAIEWCVKIALSLGCTINKESKFDRKNYYYPDLAKGYQISQYDQPFGEHGHISLKSGKAIRIRRVHMEEDTGKLIHQTIDGEKASLIDFNRSGVPLVEIVTEPDFSSAEEVKEYLQKLQLVVRYLEVSNADMEKGDMRLEPNISLSTDPKQLPKYKVEVKNINSFRFVEKAINFEIKRQEDLLTKGKTPQQETRGWDENKGVTFSQRVKEEANDYRYFPEPDIPPITFTDAEISTLRSRVPELQEEKILRFGREFSLAPYDAEILTRDRSLANFFEESVKVGKAHGINPKQIANYIINKKVDTSTQLPASLVKNIVIATQTTQVDETELQKIIDDVLTENTKAVEDFKNGKEASLMFLVGQIMRKFDKKVDVNQVKDALLHKLHGN
ncbi:MAG: Asp-tRNA(Asn)/Glu-tRNA(Gln) amidotransferase subunit GatB [Candidatus Levybacteria bacterium]|nr:Asp-tRNA(Asn)/Glu-tRNA(Gln) amidotransferase subunit GatB [Candidatus Levybacteria bacterium]